MDAQPLTIAVVAGALPGVWLVVAAGEIDHVSAPQLQQALEEVVAEHPGHIEIDLTGVTFFSCAGLSALSAAHRVAGDRLILIAAGRAVRALFAALGMRRPFGLPEHSQPMR